MFNRNDAFTYMPLLRAEALIMIKFGSVLCFLSYSKYTCENIDFPRDFSPTILTTSSVLLAPTLVQALYILLLIQHSTSV